MSDDQTPTGALTEADRFGLLHHIGAWKWESWGLAQAERSFMETVEAIVARHVAEAWPCDNFTRPVTCIGAKVSETARCSFCAAALAEAEQKGAREAVLRLAKEARERGDIGKPGCTEVWDWLDIRSAQIEVQP